MHSPMAELHTHDVADLDIPRGPNPHFTRALMVALMLMSLVALNGCQVIKGIFEAGVGVGVILVVAILAIGGGIFAVATRK